MNVENEYQLKIRNIPAYLRMATEESEEKPFQYFWPNKDHMLWLSGKRLVLESQDSRFKSRHEPLLGGNLFALNS